MTETYPPEINGVAMTLGQIVAALQARGHAVQLVRPRQASDPAAPPVNGVEQTLVTGLPIPGYADLRLGLPAKRRLLRLWSCKRPDLVHIATEGPLGWSALSAARQLAIPVVAGFHTNFHRYSRHYGLGWLQPAIHGYLRHFHNRAQLTLVPTETLRQELAAVRYRNLAVMARGVDTGLFRPERRQTALRQAWGAGENDLVVAYVGRLAPEKNLPLLLRAFAAMRQVRPDARLVLVGDGPSRAALAAKHPELIFCGARTGEDLAAHYASADCFLLPSLTETFGNVLLEAMASGLAVLGFDYAAAAEHIVPGGNGLTVPYGDEVAFIEQATRLAQQPQTLRALGQAARATALGLSWDSVFNRLEGYYRQLVVKPA
ncbi:glycosyltransferase family 4 protein [Sulfuritortus calidifontis]|uniref:glycosyltransferase family 4 protein n=1 Tax=Sulfuritortus calidifontis TaxID=1914471 RepID=UPI001E2DC40D|nr:glycosyltransferase family 1 protein [Sulfuritortus calidifontis]